MGQIEHTSEKVEAGGQGGREVRGIPRLLLQAKLVVCGLPSQHQELAFHLTSGATTLAQHLFLSEVSLLDHGAGFTLPQTPNLSVGA